MAYFSQMARFGFLAALIAGFGLFSLIVRTFDIGTLPALAEMLQYYTFLGAWAFGWTKFIGFTTPEWYTSLFVLSAVGSGIIMRAIIIPSVVLKVQDPEEALDDHLANSIMVIFPIMLSFTLMGVVIWIIAATSLINPRYASSLSERDENRTYILKTPLLSFVENTPNLIRCETLISIGSFLLLFGFNAYGALLHKSV